MRLGYITSEYPHSEVKHAAGIATSIKNLVVELVKKNIKVFVFVYNQDYDKVVNDEGVEIHLIKRKTYPIFGWYLHRKHIHNYVNQIVEKEKIDILEAPDWTGITAFSNYKVPLIIKFHGSDAYFCKLDGRKQKFKNTFFEKLALSKATAFIAPTTYAGQETQKIFGLDSKKIKTIHYGLQLDSFVNEHPDVYDEKTILYIGTIIRKKGVLELAEIFNKVIDAIPEAKLTLIGSDSPDIKTGNVSTYKMFEDLLSEKAIQNVLYLGKVPYSQVIEHIKKANVCVFPSFAETFGMVTIESMALQKPVVNTSIGWAQELIDDELNGFLVHPTKIGDYADRIDQLINDQDLCLKIGKEARNKVETTFDIAKNAQINIDYYNSILQK